MLDTYATGYLPSEERFEAAVHELNGAGVALDIVAPAEVRAPLAAITAIYHGVSARMGDLMSQTRSPAKLHEVAYRERRDELLQAVTRLKEAIRADIARDRYGS